MANGTMLQYLRTNPEVGRHELVSTSPCMVQCAPTSLKCNQIAMAVEYLHNIDMVSTVNKPGTKQLIGLSGTWRYKRRQFKIKRATQY